MRRSPLKRKRKLRKESSRLIATSNPHASGEVSVEAEAAEGAEVASAILPIKWST